MTHYINDVTHYIDDGVQIVYVVLHDKMGQNPDVAYYTDDGVRPNGLITLLGQKMSLEIVRPGVCSPRTVNCEL